MKDEEIIDAIENQPTGSDLEIALAIESDEGTVRRVRAGMVAKAEADKLERDRLAAIEKGRLAELARVTAEKEAAKAERKKLLKTAKPIPEMDTPQINQASPESAERPPLPKQRYFIRDAESNNVQELVRMNDSRTVIIFELVEA